MRVDTRRDQLMLIAPLGLNPMIEIGTGVCHGKRSCRLTYGRHDDAYDGETHAPRFGRLDFRASDEQILDEAFQDRAHLGQIIRRSIGGQKKGGNGSVSSVISGRDPKLKKVKEREQDEEEG